MLRVLILALALAAPLAAATADPPRMAVLRLEDAFNASKLFTTFTDRLKKEQAEAQASVKELEEKLQQLENSLQALPAGSDRLPRLQEEFETTKLKRELFVKRIRGDLERKHVAAIKDSYKVLRGWLKDFCKERGIRLVLQAPDPNLAAQTTFDVNMQLGMQSVLAFDEQLDITDAFLAYADQRFAQDGAPAAGATAAAPK